MFFQYRILFPSNISIMFKVISVLAVFFFSSGLFAIEPVYSIEAKGNVTDLEHNAGILYISTDIGMVQVFDIQHRRVSETIILPKIKTPFDEEIDPKIYDIAFNQTQNLLLIVSQGESGFSDLYIYNSDKILIRKISSEAKLMIKHAEFYKQNFLILGLLSNEIVKFDLLNETIVYTTQISSYTFSDMCLSPQKSRVVSSDESGNINVSNTSTGEIVFIQEGINLDNVYQLDYKRNTIATAGQDRKVGVYHLNPYSVSTIDSDFLIYSVGLSPSGNMVAYAANENNDIRIVDSYSLKKLHILEGHQALINSIEFTSENTLFTAADEKNVYFWQY